MSDSYTCLMNILKLIWWPRAQKRMGRLMMKSTVGIKWKQNEANVKCKPIFCVKNQTRNCRKSTVSRKFYQFFFVRFFSSRKKMTIYHIKSIFRTRYLGLFLCKNNQHILSKVKNLSGFLVEV